MFGGIPQNELHMLNKFWDAFPTLKNELFAFNQERYAQVKVKDIRSAIEVNTGVLAFNNTYRQAFGDYAEYLRRELVEQMGQCNIQQKHEQLTADLFQRLSDFTNLADSYQAFQFFSNEWKRIQTDLEIIQTEGEQAFREIEIDDETKEENGKLIPFHLVQSELLWNELQEIEEIDNKISNNVEKVTELFDTLTEEEKDKYANDDNSSFAPKRFPKFKRGQEFEEDTIEYRLQQVNALIAEEKSLKKERAKLHFELLQHTREKIAEMDMETAAELLHFKWTTPLCNALACMPQEVVSELAEKVQHLAEKYATTYQDIANRISTAESRLHALLGELNADTADAMGLNQFRQTLKT
jgi:type I restriction enzyme M protein